MHMFLICGAHYLHSLESGYIQNSRQNKHQDNPWATAKEAEKTKEWQVNPNCWAVNSDDIDYVVDSFVAHCCWATDPVEAIYVTLSTPHVHMSSTWTPNQSLKCCVLDNLLCQVPLAIASLETWYANFLHACEPLWNRCNVSLNCAMLYQYHTNLLFTHTNMRVTISCTSSISELTHGQLYMALLRVRCGRAI